MNIRNYLTILGVAAGLTFGAMSASADCGSCSSAEKKKEQTSESCDKEKKDCADACKEKCDKEKKDCADACEKACGEKKKDS